MNILKCLILLVSVIFTQQSLQAKKPQKKVDSQVLHVDGEFEDAGDEELKFLRDELKNVKNLRRGYKQKAKVYGKLTEESEQLKENFESYIGNRVEYEGAIGDYNKTMECLKSGDATKCQPEKKAKAKAQEKTVPVSSERGQMQQRPLQQTNYIFEDNVSSKMSAPARIRAAGGKVDFVRDIDQRIAQRGQELLGCYKSGGYSQQGVLKVQLKIAPNGNLNHLGFEDTTQINDPRVVNCLARVLYTIQYPNTPSRRVTTVRKPFVFNLM